jgi:ATP-dependent helicase HrpB
VPEILAADLTPLALELAVWGAGEGRDLAFLDPPPSGALAQARDLLAQLGALDSQGRPTAHGRAMARLGLHPRLAHMILAAAADSGGSPVNRRNLSGAPLRGNQQRDVDLRARIAILRGARSVDRTALNQARALSKQWMRLAKRSGSSAGDLRLGEIALAYRRIAPNRRQAVPADERRGTLPTVPCLPTPPRRGP